MDDNHILQDRGLPVLRPVAEIQTIQSELDLGIQHELEHTTDRTVARQIALHHLAEFPFYYTFLSKVERQMRDGALAYNQVFGG